MFERAPRELDLLVVFDPVFDRGMPRIGSGAAPALAARFIEEVQPA